MTDTQQAPAPPKKRRRGLKLLLLLFVLVIGVVASAPYWALGLAKPKVEAAMSEAMNSDVTIGEMKASWGGASVSELSIVGKDGYAHASLAEMDMKVSTFKALTGQYDVTATIRGGRIQARQDEAGRWSFADLGGGAPAAEGEDTPTEASGPVGEPPQLSAKLNLEDVEVLVETPKGTRTVSVTRGTVDVERLDQPAQVTILGTISGSGLEAQELKFDGELVPWDFVGSEPSGHVLSSQFSLGEALTLSASAPSPNDPAGAKLNLGVTLGPILEMIAPFVELPVPSNGRFEMEAALGDDNQGSQVTLRLLDGKADMETAPALAMVHPIFAGLDASQGGALSGGLEAELKLELPGRANIAEWLEDPPLQSLIGTGNIQLKGLGIQGSDWLNQLTGKLGVTPQQLDLAPLAFKLGGGDLTYAEPWAWKVAGSPTNFLGGMGMDGSLELDWKVPLVADFVRKLNLPEELVGEELVLPLRGNVLSPKVPWKEALTGLAKKGAEAELRNRAQEELDKVLPGGLDGALQDVLPGGVEEKLKEVLPGGIEVPEAAKGLLEGVGLPKDGEKAAKLLMAEADKLFAEGKKDEAKPLYAKIREDYRLTSVYLLNRSKIKDRD